MSPIAETRLSIVLDRKRELIFNVNAIRAYERASGKNYWDTMLKLFEFSEQQQTKLTPDLPDGKRSNAQLIRMSLELLRHVSIDELATLLWAACHEYRGKKPVWPLELDEVGTYLLPQDTPRILNLIIQGHAANSPTKAELGEASGAGGTAPSPAEASPQISGEPSIELPAGAFV